MESVRDLGGAETVIAPGNISSVRTERRGPGFFPGDGIREMMETGWERACARMDSEGRSYFDGPLLRFEGTEERDAERVIYVSPSIRYSQVVGFREDWSRPLVVPENGPNALSVISVLRTSDGAVVFPARKKTGDRAACYELPGGFVRPDEEHDLPGSAGKRIREDLGQDTIQPPRFFGACAHREFSETTLVFEATIGSTDAELRKEDVFLFPDPCLRAFDELMRLHADDPVPWTHPHSEAIFRWYLGVLT